MPSTLEGLVIFGSIHVLLTLWEPLSVLVTEEGDVLVGNDDFKIWMRAREVSQWRKCLPHKLEG